MSNFQGVKHSVHTTFVKKMLESKYCLVFIIVALLVVLAVVFILPTIGLIIAGLIMAAVSCSRFINYVLNVALSSNQEADDS